MRNTCSRFHPPEYDPRANEQFYESMAQKGWLLETRDVYWSTFRRSEPQDLRYQVEYCGDYDMPQSRLDFYRSSGWTLAARQRNIFIFSAPAHTPSLIEPPDRQAEYVRGLDKKTGPFLAVATVRMAAALLVLLAALIGVAVTQSLPDAVTPSFACVAAGLVLLFLGLVIMNVRFSSGYRRLYRSLTGGQALSGGSYQVWRIITVIVFVLGALSILLGLLTGLPVLFAL